MAFLGIPVLEWEQLLLLWSGEQLLLLKWLAPLRLL